MPLVELGLSGKLHLGRAIVGPQGLSLSGSEGGLSAMAVVQLSVLEQLEATEQWSLAGVPGTTNRPERADTVLRALSASPYFQNIDVTALERLAEAAVTHRYRKNQVLFIEGDTSRTLHFIVSGLVKVYQLTRDGRERIDTILGAGELTGAIAFCDGASYPVSAEIVEDAHIALFRWEDFDDIARGNADVLYALLKLMAKRLRQSQADIHALALHSATARLAAKLLDLADAFGKVNDVGIEIQLTLNREQLGALVGTSRETTTRVLRQFEQDQVVQLDGPIVTIVKPFILQTLSED